ncbi:zinc finger protein 513-like [Diaphorina citri]|uniref:Zinc finger protein 513-like n=1 Tax=Diaphorina citri TaxID=121845 RepID=A0A3Q0IQP7_DIACI|nr:zinc finger protein 513-like [Diaphorina citri]
MILHCKTCTSMPRPDAFRCKFVCNVCPYGAYSNQAIRNHILSHTGEKPYACSYCSYACAHKNASSKRHVNYSCKHCGSFSTYDIDVMVEHCRLCPSMHRPDAFKFKFVCYECNYGAYQTAMIKGHIWSHTGEKPFACNFYIFKGHPLSCLHCKDFMTTDFDQLIQHCKFCAYMPRPNPYKCKYVCYQCNYSSYHIIPFKDILNQVYSCVHCNSFETSNMEDLIHHCKTCSFMPRPNTYRCKFVCYQCSHGSYQLAQFKSHIFQHMGHKPFKCNFCSFACTFKSNLNQHLKMVHRFINK